MLVGKRDLGIAGADDVGAGELGGEADEEAAERLVAVEAAVVGPHALAVPRDVSVGGGGRVDPQPLRRGGSGRRERRHGGERAPDLGSADAKERRGYGSLRNPPGGGEHTSLPVRRERWDEEVGF